MTKVSCRLLRWWSVAGALALVPACDSSPNQDQSIEVQQEALTRGAAPAQIKVMPVFLVPQGETSPSTTDQNRLRDHLAWAQTRYKEMLKGRDTFQIAGSPVVIADSHDHTYWEAASSDGLLYQKLFSKFKVDRFSNPYIYVMIELGVSGSTYGVPTNGGINTGGGMVRIRKDAWTSTGTTDPVTNPKIHFQSTLQHELGHTFGLIHSWNFYPTGGAACDPDPYPACNPYPSPLACRFSTNQGWTIMSYNKCHWTNEMTASAHQGILLPEDIAVLALNKRVFPNLYFDPETDLPSGVTGVYRWGDNPGFATIPPPEVSANLTAVTTSSGETYGSSVANIARNPITRSPLQSISIRKSDPTVGFDAATMWHSAPTANGWVSVQVQFPMAVSLNRLGVHTQHSGASWDADLVKVEAGNPFAFVTQQATAVDDMVSFTATTASQWQFSFHSAAGNNGYVVVRGLQFFTADGEIFPSYYPTELVNYPKVTTAFGESAGKVAYVVTGWPVPPNNAQTGFKPTQMWKSGPTNSSGWVSLEVTFPYPVTVNGLEAYTQYGGQYGQASQVQLEYDNGTGFTFVTRQNTGPDATLSFSQVKARHFKVAFYSTSGYAVVRKLRFKSPLTNGYLERPDCITGPQVLPPY